MLIKSPEMHELWMHLRVHMAHVGACVVRCAYTGCVCGVCCVVGVASGVGIVYVLEVGREYLEFKGGVGP